MLQKITHDLFNINTRLKAINPSYQLYFNNQRQRFEVHTSHGLQFIPPYETLDERALEYAYKTRIENQPDLETQIESHNRELEQSTSHSIEAEQTRLSDMLHYATGRTGQNVIFAKQKTWI